MSSGSVESAAGTVNPRVLVFPGVGVKPSGFELALAECFPDQFQAGFDRTAATSGRQLWPALLDGSFASLPGLDEQLFSFTFAVVSAELVSARYGPPAAVAGNSFGVYPALCAAGALSWAACVDILAAAYRIMEAAAARSPASICAVVGLGLAELASLVSPPLLHINSANDTCHIFCGPPESVASLERRALEGGALSVSVLPLALPYHHPGYHGAGPGQFRGLVAAQDWRSARFPLVSTIDRRFLVAPADLADFVARQVFEPIDWSALIHELYARGFGEFYECGPGVSLTQNARFIEGEAVWHNCRKLSRSLVTHG